MQSSIFLREIQDFGLLGSGSEVDPENLKNIFMFYKVCFQMVILLHSQKYITPITYLFLFNSENHLRINVKEKI